MLQCITILGLLVLVSQASPAIVPRATTFKNPILWEDLPDLDVFRVGDVYYYSTSTFAYSPGAPVLKSYDLVNWTPVTHSVPVLDFGSKYNLNSPSDRAYVKGIWASTLRYRQSNDMFYWIGCIESSKTYIYTSPGNGAGNKSGEVSSWNWKKAATLNKCYYDCGLLIDDDDTMYVAYGNKNIQVSQLSKDGLSEVKSQQVYTTSTNIEGSHMYKVNGYYYIIPTKVASGEWVLRSKSPWGPYEQKVLFDNLQGPLSSAGYAHQGGIVSTKDGKWYYIAFMDSYPGGRIPVMAPMTWANDWPQLVTDNGRWGLSYPSPIQTNATVPPPTGIDKFIGSSLGPEWEWNHNPDTTKWKLTGGEGGLSLQTATVTDDLFTARNTLTHRILGPKSVATFVFDISQMKDGDRAGAALLRDTSAYIGIHKSGSTASLVMVNGLSLTSSWSTQSKGSVAATGPSVNETVYLRITADITPAFNQQPVRPATFSYSTDGLSYKQLGPNFLLTNTWQYFTAYRYSAFNFATKALGGQVTLKQFSMELA